MGRYIEVDKLKEMIEAKADTLIEGKQAFLYVSKWLDLLPYMKIVQCKDCVFNEKRQGACDYCRLHDSRFDKDSFCSYGKRR